MPSPGCACCYEETFDTKVAQRELRDLRRNGPGKTSRAIVEALAAGGIEGLTVLDIGGGVGAVHQALLERGAAAALDIDLSTAYLEAARSEAARRGTSDRATYRFGNFAETAAEVEPADLVAMDRVVCCYADADGLVTRAAERTRRRLGIVLPRDDALGRLVVGLGNAWFRLTRSAYRGYVHPLAAVGAAARRGGLVPVGPPARVDLAWRLLVFERSF